MDLIGASSYVWHWKHAVVHHTYTNLTGHDADIALGFVRRSAEELATKGTITFAADQIPQAELNVLFARSSKGEH